MAKYECNSCGMSVNTSCGNCDADLVNGSLELEDGSSVQIAECLMDVEKLNHHFVVAKI